MRSGGLNTVCEEARCPNRTECFGHGTATFLINGKICTRNCSYCSIAHGRPEPLDPDEPKRLVETVRSMGLHFVVITAVDRDDLPDGGASMFAATIHAIRQKTPDVGIEVLIPDFHGSADNLQVVLDAAPDVINHNIETTRRVTPIVRRGANYDRSLELLARVAESGLGITTKSGVIVGMGESIAGLQETFEDLAHVSCQLLTIGQYLAPSEKHHPIEKYYRPEEFDELKDIALDCGIESVIAGPLVRSSYHAREQSDMFKLVNHQK